ncbi:MAG TPA: metallophosphoesterase family protein [Bacillota bacterium]|nr:metallophosphoesterase family protein [Bacillota bacterium]HPT86324.1 metallophosphoesterase family protein [Bacillota bacterium]
MKVAVIADTHRKHSLELTCLIELLLKEADTVIHAGDFTTGIGLESFILSGKLIGVSGNGDQNSVSELLPEKRLVTLENYRIGICHGHGTIGKTVERAYAVFQDEMVDIIIFGHSHQPLIQTKNRILMINPGSICSKRKERWYTYIMLKLGYQHITTEIKFMENSLIQ